MNSFRNDGFAERRSAAAEAKKALLEKFKARPSADDPEVIARLEERKAILAAREERNRQKEIERQARMEREARERAEREEQERIAREAAEEAARIEAERLAAEEREKLALLLASEAEKKAKRDARYAARKQRAGKRW